jgi:hypothetical protein
MKCTAVKAREEMENLVYGLVNAQPEERRDSVKAIKENQSRIYQFVSSEVSRISASLEKKQNKGNRASLVVSFARLVVTQTLLEEYHAETI